MRTKQQQFTIWRCQHFLDRSGGDIQGAMMRGRREGFGAKHYTWLLAYALVCDQLVRRGPLVDARGE